MQTKKRLFLNIKSTDVVDGFWVNDVIGISDDGMFEGKNQSPQLSWNKVDNAKSYVVTIIDYEAQNTIGTPFIHWLVANIKTNELARNASGKDDLVEGFNSLATPLLKGLHGDKSYEDIIAQDFVKNYTAPACPDTSHNYEVAVYALDVDHLNLKTPYHLADLQRAIIKHIIVWDKTTFRAHMPNESKPKHEKLYVDESKLVDLHVHVDNVNQSGFIHNDHIHSHQASSPKVSWNKVDGVDHYAVVMIDEEATSVTGGLIFVHWLVSDLDKTYLEINESKLGKLNQGENSGSKNFDFKGFGAPIIPAGFLVDDASKYFAPMPPDQDHKYHIIVYGYKGKLNLKPGYKLGELSRALHGKVIAEGHAGFFAKQMQ